jgi:hypothetical protein
MFRFTIRDVLWLTVVVALLAAWWLDRRSSLAQMDEAQHDIQTLLFREGSRAHPFE